jgi:hypothetical protein
MWSAKIGVRKNEMNANLSSDVDPFWAVLRSIIDPNAELAVSLIRAGMRLFHDSDQNPYKKNHRRGGFRISGSHHWTWIPFWFGLLRFFGQTQSALCGTTPR